MLWRGLGPTLARDIPFSMIYWYGYEHIKLRLVARSVDPLTVSFTAGLLAGSVAAALTTPFDVVKTRVQIISHSDTATEQRLESAYAPKATRHPLPSSWAVAQNLFATEGWRGFLTGLVPRIARVAPSCAIMIASYETGKSYFARRAQKQGGRPFEAEPMSD